METMRNFWAILLITLLCPLKEAQGTRVKFFEKSFYHGFIKEVELNGAAEAECVSLRSFVSTVPLQVGSIKTDRCLILYSNEGCRPLDNNTRSFRVEKNVRDLQFTSITTNLTRAVGSFHVCSQSRGGGSQVNVDFYDQKHYGGSILAKFRNVCGCQNLPRDARGGKSRNISVDNHGRSIDLFESENCKAEYRTLEAGHSAESENVWISRKVIDPTEREDRVFDVRSFRPSGGMLSCLILFSRIFKFHFRNAINQNVQNGIVETAKLAPDTILRNHNQTTKLVHDYWTKLNFTETVDFRMPGALANIETVGLDLEYEWEVESRVPVLSSDRGQAWKQALQQRFLGATPDNIHHPSLLANNRTISLKKRIEIPACSECVISKYAKILWNFPIEYTAFAMVRGISADERMSAEEIRTYLEPGTEYLGTMDDQTIAVAVQGTVLAKAVTRMYISSNCELLPECGNASWRSSEKKMDNFEVQLS